MNTTTGARFDILHDGEEAAERSLESAVMSACGTVSGITDRLIDDITPTGFETPTFISNEVKDAYIEVTERLMTDMFHEGRLAIPGSRKADVEALIASGAEDIFSVRDALQSADDKFHLYGDFYEITTHQLHDYLNSNLENLRIELAGTYQPQITDAVSRSNRNDFRT